MSSTSSLSPRSSFESLRADSPAPSHFEPDLLAPKVEGAQDWDSNTLEQKKAIVKLTPEDVEHIRSAIIRLRLLYPRDPQNPGAEFTNINKETFVLPDVLSAKLSSISEMVHLGQGLAILRGLNLGRFNDEEAMIAFIGINAHVASHRATDDYANQTISHIRDATHEKVPDYAKDIGLAGSKITTAMEYHSDRYSGDVISLYLRNLGNAGGEQYIASFSRIYNDLLERDPQVLETLAAPDWPFELKQKNTTEPKLDLGPLLFFTPSTSKPIIQLVKAPLTGTPRIPRSPSMPSLTPTQEHALHAVQHLAQKYGAKLDRRADDIQYVNNLSTMHARDAYGGGEDAGKPSERHFLRMFLRDERLEWEKPVAYKDRFENPFKGIKEEFTIVDLDPWRKISGRESHG